MLDKKKIALRVVIARLIETFIDMRVIANFNSDSLVTW